MADSVMLLALRRAPEDNLPEISTCGSINIASIENYKRVYRIRVEGLRLAGGCSIRYGAFTRTRTPSKTSG
jgi:hypothetical protein